MSRLAAVTFALAFAAQAALAAEAQPETKPLAVQKAGIVATGPALPANTEVTLSMNEDLTTKGGRIEEGTQFDLSVTQDVKYEDYVVIPKGSRGVGEVTWLTGKGAFGKSGKMEIELRYVEVNGARIPIIGKFRQEGEGNTAATIGAVVAVGVFGGFVTGKSARIPRGRELVAFTKEPVPLEIPTAN